MGRTLLASAFVSLCLFPTLGEAQMSPSGPAAGLQTPGPPRGIAPIGVGRGRGPGPGRIASPLPRDLVPPAPPSALDRVDLFRAGPRTFDPRFNRGQLYPFYGYGGYGASGYITDPFGYVTQPYTTRPADERAGRDGEGPGYLRLDVGPDSARVYVDGLYIGAVSDFRRAGRALDAGPHRVEVRADGFESLSFETRIRPNDTTTYQGTLTPIPQRAEARPAAAPKTFYVIPRCYAGDTRPRADQLPAGCRVGNLRTIPPVVAPPGR
jgi:PEGA domain